MKNNHVLIHWLFCALAVATSTCGPAVDAQSSPSDGITRGYGRERGRTFSKSLNGISVFAEMVRNRGVNVDFANRISPRIENYQTIIWLPDRFQPPSTPVVNRLNRWLAADSQRTMIYVGRDYDASIDYWKAASASTVGMQRQLAQRRLADAITQFESYRKQAGGIGRCDWFQVVEGVDRRVQAGTGDWSVGESEIQCNILTGTLQLVPTQFSALLNRPTRTFLETDDGPFAFEFQGNSYSGSSVIVVSNASFIVNYGLIDKRNRQLADNLLDEIWPYGDVLFLVSGPDEIPIMNSDIDQGTQWAWIAEPPLRYIVPHFLLVGVVFCFAFYPIFGRPKSQPLIRTTNFGMHVNAIASTLRGSTQKPEAMRAIERCSEAIYHRSSQKKSNSPM